MGCAQSAVIKPAHIPPYPKHSELPKEVPPSQLGSSLQMSALPPIIYMGKRKPSQRLPSSNEPSSKVQQPGGLIPSGNEGRGVTTIVRQTICVEKMPTNSKIDSTALNSESLMLQGAQHGRFNFEALKPHAEVAEPPKKPLNAPPVTSIDAIACTPSPEEKPNASEQAMGEASPGRAELLLTPLRRPQEANIEVPGADSRSQGASATSPGGRVRGVTRSPVYHHNTVIFSGMANYQKVTNLLTLATRPIPTPIAMPRVETQQSEGNKLFSEAPLPKRRRLYSEYVQSVDRRDSLKFKEKTEEVDTLKRSISSFKPSNPQAEGSLKDRPRRLPDDSGKEALTINKKADENQERPPVCNKPTKKFKQLFMEDYDSPKESDVSLFLPPRTPSKYNKKNSDSSPPVLHNPPITPRGDPSLDRKDSK